MNFMEEMEPFVPDYEDEFETMREIYENEQEIEENQEEEGNQEEEIIENIENIENTKVPLYLEFVHYDQ